MPMLSKQIALVTGGSRGIGRAICLELAKNGSYVIINFRSNKKAAEDTLELIQHAGGTGETVCFDVANHDETEKSVEALLMRHEAIDILVNNAGEAADSLFALMSFEEWSESDQHLPARILQCYETCPHEDGQQEAWLHCYPLLRVRKARPPWPDKLLRSQGRPGRSLSIPCFGGGSPGYSRQCRGTGLD